MRRRIVTGIDIGTHQIKVVISESVNGKSGGRMPQIIGTGFAESKGLRHGYIINSPDVIRSIQGAVSQAEKEAGVRVKKAFLAVGGVGLSSIVSEAHTIVSRADSVITQTDIDKAVEAAEEEIPESLITNRKIIHSIPLEYKIDGNPVLGRPSGMKGMKLEAKVLFITSLEHHLNDLIDAVEAAGVEVVDVTAAPLAASFVTLTKTQKIAGCVLANIGAETVSIVVFENNIPISLEIFPIGSTDITHDIALGLKIPIEEAEQIKIGSVTSTTFPRKKLEEIVTARLSDMFELIEAHLKKIGRNGLLPAGIIITGGGSGIGTIEDFAKSALKLPSKIASFNFGTNKVVKDATWSVAYGLCIWGLTSDADNDSISLKGIFSGFRRLLGSFIKQFLP